MKKFGIIATAALALVATSAAEAKTLPNCNMLQVGKAFSGVFHDRVMFFDVKEVDRNAEALKDVRSAQDDQASTRNQTWVIRRFLNRRWWTFFLVQANGIAVS